MNQRIRQLADQAELTIRDSRGNTYMSHPEFNKKFAELNIQECAGVADKTVIGTDKVGKAIKQHFGVKS